MRKHGFIKLVLLSLLLAIAVPGICGMGSVSKVEAKASLNKKKSTIKFKKTVTLKVSGATKKVQWTSSNPGAVKIKKISGSKRQIAVCQGVGKGKSVITAKIGKTKLKATINVKHTHKYSYPATCTVAAHCECGATYGPALGHSFVDGNCVTRAHCGRPGCGAIGSFGGHLYDRQHICEFCHSVEIDQALEFSFVKGSGDFILLKCTNSDDIGWLSQNYKLYPANASGDVYDLTIASDDGRTLYPEWTFHSRREETVRLNIPVALNIWNTPRLEFDLFCTVSWTQGSGLNAIRVSKDQVYHVTIVGAGTDTGSSRKTYTYVRTL